MAAEEHKAPMRNVTVASATNGDGYVVPLVHTQLPARAVEMGFWGGLVAATVVGALDPPLALILAAGVVIARHRMR